MHRNLLPALIVAREDEALKHGQVMYGLVKPTKDMDQIESTAAMVNVIPKRRIYRMETREEIDLFMRELLKRPLVLQPSAHKGNGLAKLSCTLYTKEEHWVLLVNQSHSKIQSYIKKGIDTAKSRMECGEPFILELSFNEFLKRAYFDRMTEKQLNQRFTFIEFVDAEIVIRYPGNSAHRSLQWQLLNKPIRYKFEDILPGELLLRTVTSAEKEWGSPALRVIMPDELSSLLPGWEFEDIDPLALLPETSDDKEYGDEESTVACISVPQVEAPPTGRILGRQMRKTNNSTSRYEVPVEIYAPEAHGTQSVNRLPASPVSPSGQSSEQSTGSKSLTSPKVASPESLIGRSVESPRGTAMFDNLDRRNYANVSSTYESFDQKLQVQRKLQYLPDSISSSNAQDISQYSGPKPSKTSLAAPLSPKTCKSAHVVPSPRVSHSKGQRSPLHNAGAPLTPLSAAMLNSADRYNTELVNNLRPSQKMYLTDDNDDGGFSLNAQRSRSDNARFDDAQRSRSYNTRSDNGYNHRSADADRCRNPEMSSRTSFDPRQSADASNSHISEAYVSPSRVFHRHQGSQRSDTSTSDSGFGETDLGFDSSRPRTDKYLASQNGGMKTKTPFYNRAFEDDVTDHADILAKHKAMAAKMFQQNGSNSKRPGNLNDVEYQLKNVQKLKNEQSYNTEHVVKSFDC